MKQSREPWTRLRSTVAATLLLVVSLSSCSDGRSTEAFCDELDRGVAAMSSNTQASGDDLEDLLLLIVGNAGEFSRMVNRLSDVAPDDIQTEMETVAESWNGQAEMLESVASNPFGAIAAGILQSILDSGSYQAVDQFALDNCGGQVFGSVSAPGTSATVEADGQDQTLTTGCEELGTRSDYLAATAPYGSLRSGLEVLTAGTITQPAATRLIDAVELLDPAPKTSGEALGRLSFTADGRESVRAFASAVDSCGGGGSDDVLDGAVPRLDGNRVAGFNSWQAEECEHVGLTSVPETIFVCGREVVWMDLTTGDTVRQGGAPALDDATVSPPHVVGDGTVAWLSNVVTESSGLALPALTVTVHMVDPDDGVIEIVVGEQLPTAPYTEGGFVLRGSEDGFLVTVPHEPEEENADVSHELVMVDSDGQVRWSRIIESYPEPWNRDFFKSMDGVRAAGSAIIETSTGDDLVDLERHSSNWAITVDVCGTNGYVGLYSDGHWVTTTGAGVSVSPRHELSSFLEATAVGGVYSDHTGVFGIGIDGSTMWSIPKTVVGGVVASAGRWVVVQNVSGVNVILDALTGEERAPTNPLLRDMLSQGEQIKMLASDDEGRAWVTVDDQSLVPIPRAELCE